MVALFLALFSSAGNTFARPEPSFDDLFAGRPGAAIVLRVSDAKILRSHGERTLRQRTASPGSAIKPFVLELLLERGVVSTQTRIACHRPLTIAGRRLDCSHPSSLISFNAVEALAYSCNKFFVTAAAQLPRGALEQRYRELDFTRASGLMSDEGEGKVTPENSVADRQLLAVGAAGIQITPLELASAYLRLARLDAQHATPAQQVVLEGLRGSADYGMAAAVRPANITVAGKTGTAADPGQSQTHAWFAGFAPADHPEIVVVVFLERGHGGAEAALIANEIFKRYGEHQL